MNKEVPKLGVAQCCTRYKRPEAVLVRLQFS